MDQSPDLGLSLSNMSPSAADRWLFRFVSCDWGPGSIRLDICIEGMGWLLGLLGLLGLGPEDVGLGGYCIGGWNGCGEPLERSPGEWYPTGDLGRCWLEFEPVLCACG